MPLEASATAFMEARDLVLVLDFSASMNDDSSFNSSLSISQVISLLDGMWDSLVAANPKWPGTTQSKFPSTGFGQLIRTTERMFPARTRTRSATRSD